MSILKTPWREEEVDVLRKLAAKNYTILDAAEVLKSRTLESIKRKCVTSGIEMGQNPKPEIDMDAFARLMKAKGKG